MDALDPEERKWVKDLYLAEIRWVDEQVGLLLNELKRLRLYDESLIILTSDHGEEFWEHGHYYHGHTLYQELLHVPLIIKLPRRRESRVVEATVSTVAVTPTILDLAGIPFTPTSFSAMSLRPYLETPTGRVAPRPVFSAGGIYENWLAVIFGNAKYIRRVDSSIEETYDLEQDPKELNSPFSRTVAERGRTLVNERLEADLRIRASYGLTAEPERVDVDSGTESLLRSLGYIQ